MSHPVSESPVTSHPIPETPVRDPQERQNQLVWGVLLIGLGLFFLFARTLDLGLLVMPLLSIAFITGGVLTREAGLFIPGGILGGIGLGIVAMGSSLVPVSGDAEGGVFLLCFALGWLSIPLLTKLFTGTTHWWPLIPGGIMALIGGALLFGGILGSLLELLGNGWPLILIAGGILLLLDRRAGRVS